MSVVVARMVAQLEAETTQFHARMTAAERQLTKWTSSAGTAARGAAMFKTGIQQLAFEGLGVMPPALARVSAGLLTVFGPAGIMIGAIAVLGVVSLAFERAGKKAQEFVEEANRVREFQLSHMKMLGGVGPEFQMTDQEQLANLLTLRTRVTELMDTLKQVTPNVHAQLTGTMDPAVASATLKIDALTNSLRNLNRAIAMINAAPAMERFNFMVSNLRGVTGFEFTRGGLRRGGFQAPTFGGPGPQELHFLPRDPFAGISTHFGRGVTPPAPKKGFQLSPEFAIMSSMALLQGAQGGPASFFGAAAGPVGMINPLAGAITAGLGGLFSMFDNSEERRHRQLVDTIKQLGEEVGLERVTVVFTGPDGHQVRRSLAELEESDAVERVPGPVGAGG